MSLEEQTSESQKRITAVRQLTPSDFAVWKHYEERAAQLGTELWTMGSWLSAILSATLALPFIAKFIQPQSVYPYFALTNRIGLAMVSSFGILFCIHSYFAISDVREHIESNWRKAGFVLQGTWQFDWKGRKGHGWIVLQVIGWSALVAFVILFSLAMLPG